MPFVFRAPARAALAVAAVVLASCNIERTTALTVGEPLSIGEQVAIEAAYAKAARILKDSPSDEDSVLAELGAVAARLVRLQGHASTIAMTSGSGSTTLTMKGVALRSEDAQFGGTIELVFAWEGIDENAFTVDRVVLIQRTGTGSSTTARFVQVEPPSTTFLDGTGTLTFAGGAFDRACAGVGGAGGACSVGSFSVQATLDALAPAALTGEFGPEAMTAFNVVVD